MTQAAIEALLRQKIGLDANTIGSSTIARAVNQRMVDCGFSDTNSYLIRLQTSTQELEELIENAIVPETWFFRDREPFVFLSRYAIADWWPKHRNGVLRVLSMPCSTGEEPYSIAIALIESGLTPKQFCIDAVDISKKSLLRARNAIYSKNSFRGENLVLPNFTGTKAPSSNSFSWRERYFEQTADGYQLCDLVKNTVNFTQCNLLDSSFLVGKTAYDVIFCRNVLIYFDSLARERTVNILYRLLTNQGLLFVGHAETSQILAPRFVPVPHPLAFVYRKIEDSIQKLGCEEKSKISTQQPQRTEVSRQNALKASLQNISTPQKSTLKPAQTTQNFTQPSTSILETAQSLADRGRLDEAATLCKTYLGQNRVSAEAYVLLGVVRMAAGNRDEAEQCFHKAIYLAPNHYEALTHLALLKEHRGDISSAAVIQQRIQRLQKLQSNA